MTERPPPDELRQPEDAVPPADAQMAEILSSSTSNADARARLGGDTSPIAEDLLGRLNALDFVDSVVGTEVDVPARIGEYSITGVLGRGGMGTVYLAFQEQLEREVALKVLLPSFTADPTMRQRFRAEARATAALHHRHIVPIYDYGETQGRLYFAMERVHGLSLDKHIAQARRAGRLPLPPEEASRRFAGVADALGLAHRRRILHRDVKPGNILVGSDGTLALTDFGLAKALDQASARLTSKAGGFLGTLHYSPPEQALGRDLTPASDLYSLGVTLFEAVTGKLPLEGKTTEAMLQSILYGTPRRLRELLPSPPRDLEAVLDKLLSREPGDRYQDGEALSRDLLRIADGEPVQIRRQSQLLRLWRRARRNPVLASAIVAAAVLLLVVVSLFTVLRREKGQSLQYGHQINLFDIANDVKMETTPLAGVADLVWCLCGVEVADSPPGPRILDELDKAAAELPDDGQVEAMRQAYTSDPLPPATLLLRKGRGYEALQQLDAAIAQAVERRTGNDLSVEFSLYRLYLARAAANLTAAVARLDAARSDLTLASFLRPGAIFPKALVAAIDAASATAVPAALERLQRDWKNDSPQRQAVAVLLWTAAGLQPSPQANLMAFPLAASDRRRLHQFARRWMVAAPPAAEADDCTGLEGEVLRIGRAAAQATGAAGLLAQQLQAGRELLRTAVHPDSPLQCWRVPLLLLEQAATGAGSAERDLRALPVAEQLAGWERLLRLRPESRLLKLLLPQFETLRQGRDGQPEVLRIAACMHLRIGLADAAMLAQQWVEADVTDPQAVFCRLQVRLGRGDADGVLDDAIRFVQLAVDRGVAVGQLCACLQERLQDDTGEAAPRLRQLLEAFRALG